MTQQLHPHVPASPPGAPTAWTGWILFGAVMLLIDGMITAVQGLVALLDDGYFLVRAGDRLLVADYDVWGPVLLAWAAVLLVTGACVALGLGWARWLAIAVAALSNLMQIAFLAADPIWSAVVIAFDALVIFALSAHWADVERF